MSEVNLIFDSGPKAEVRIRRNDIEADVRQELRIVPPTEHNALLGLDYEHSGHTGFASQKEISVLVPQNLSILPKSNLNNRDAKIFLDNNGRAEYTTVGETLNAKIRTVRTMPDDLKTGDYIFMEMKK